LLGWLGVLGAAVALINVLSSLADRQRWLLSKVGDSATGLACMAFVWFIFTWNFMVFSLKY